MKYIKSLLNSVLHTLLLLMCIIVLIAFGAYQHFLSEIPDYTKTIKQKMPEITRIYTANGNILSEYWIEKRIYVEIDAIPQKIISAFLAAEDKNFYIHSGVDPTALIRAIMHNLNISGKKNLSTVGGSTITQQLAKNLFLGPEKTLKRKIYETILAFKINNSLSKDKILELYLNKIYFGHGAYGIKFAALTYFGKDINTLSIEEAALLASLPQAPSKLDPTKNNSKILQRRNWVIDKMHECGYISLEENEIAKQKKIELNINKKHFSHNSEFFTDEVRKILSKNYDKNKLYTEKMFIKTTLIEKHQEIASNALINGLREYDTRNPWRGPIKNITLNYDWKKQINAIPDPEGLYEWKLGIVLKISTKNNQALIGMKSGEKGLIKNTDFAPNLAIGDIIIVEKNDKNYYKIKQIPEINGAIIAMEPKTGKVLAMVGGYNYSKMQFNLSTQSERQPGSCLKPFIYLAALENGLKPNTIINDQQIDFHANTDLEPWLPRNFENKFFGPTTLRHAIEFSRNVIPLQITEVIGMHKIRNILKRFDLYHNYSDLTYASILGANEISLIKLVTAYSSIANGGFKVYPEFIEEISDRDGNSIFKRDKRLCENCNFEAAPEIQDNRERIIKEELAYQLTSLLEGTVTRGYSRNAKSLKIVLAGKTGTSNEFKDAWFIGFTPNIVVGVYVGFNSPQVIANNATGARLAIPIFKNFMQEYLKLEFLNTPFKTSENIEFINIDGATGMLQTPDTKIEDVILETFLKNKTQNSKQHLHDIFLKYDEIFTENQEEEKPSFKNIFSNTTNT